MSKKGDTIDEKFSNPLLLLCVSCPQFPVDRHCSGLRVASKHGKRSGRRIAKSCQRLTEIGIESGLNIQPEAVRQKTLEDIHALDVTWFRDGPSSGSAQAVKNFIEEVRLAKQENLKFLVNIVQMDEDYDVPLTMHSHGWKAKKLSQINLDKFAQRFRNLLDALKAANLTIDAVEFGNEDDSYYYDADVPNGRAATTMICILGCAGMESF